MIKHINDKGKPSFTEVTPDDVLTRDLFYYPVYQGCDDEPDDWNTAFHCNLGSLTVVDRMTGFGFRDVESGYRDPAGAFWLASGGYNVMKECEGKSIAGAIHWIKENANACKGGE
jgi:hypothetical protein